MKASKLLKRRPEICTIQTDFSNLVLLKFMILVPTGDLNSLRMLS